MREIIHKNFIEKNKFKIFFIISFFFLFIQIDFIFTGGTTWDQISYIRGTGKQIEKAILTIFDNDSSILNNFDYTEGRGILVGLPIHIFSRYEYIQNIFSSLIKSNSNVITLNNLEVQYILRHLGLGIYFIIINFFIFKKLSKITNSLYAILFYLFLCLTPSISGHSLFNNADIPYALQYLLCTVFYIDYINNKNKVFKKIPYEYLLGIIFGMCLVIRINGVVFLGALSVFHLYFIIKHKKSYLGFVFSQFKIYTTSVITLYVLSPSMWINPISWIEFAILDQFRHPNDVQTVVNGTKVLASDTGPFYLLIWFYYKLPIVFLFLFFIALGRHFYYKSTHKFSQFSVFFIIYVQIIFMVLKPPAYDGIRHYLFLIPFILSLSADIVSRYLNKINLKNIFMYSIIFSYLFYTQAGLGPYRYAYFNEFVDENEISYICDEALNGCGDWATDYWGFSGKEMYNISKKYSDQTIYYCSPGETYTSYMVEKSPWRLTNGQPDFDDEMVWNQDEFIFSRLKFFDLVQESKGSDFSIYAMTIHRPGNDNCFFNTFSKDEMSYSCELVDSVTRELRSKTIYLNYLYDCNIKVSNY
tara:strand:- start:153 stop:1910 length:1758 start_codon:yes stop_codon:yes gene_type:complete